MQVLSGSSQARRATESARSAFTRLFNIVRRPETIACGVLLFIAIMILEVTGYAAVARIGMLNIAAFAIFALLTDRSDQKRQRTPGWTTQRKTRFRTVLLWIQIVILGLFIILSARDLLWITGLTPLTTAFIPYWSQLEFAFEPTVTGSRLIYGSYQVAPTLLIALAIVLFFFGARPREMGVTGGQHSWRQAWLWSCAPLLLFVTGRLLLNPQAAFIRLIWSLCVVAPVQELLFRGALMTRLSRAFSNGWGLVLSALVFGLWHVGLVSVSIGATNLVVGGAAAFVSYGVLGLATGTLLLRTRTLLAPTILHGFVAAAFL